MKKIMGTLFIMLFLLPMQSFAANGFVLHEKYDPYDVIRDIYYDSSRDAIHVPFSGTRVNKTVMKTYDDTWTNSITTKTYVATDSGYLYYTATGFTCNTNYIAEIYDKSNTLIARIKITVTGLVNPKCDSTPDPADMGGNADCDPCALFDCPGWDSYMGKLDDIKAAIPPPPNWSQVSQTFSDAIVPRLVNETSVMLGNLLGTAPAPPAPAPDLPSMQDGGFRDQEPTMPNVPAIGDVNKNDIQYGGPKIPIEEDPTGGFKLNVDPVVGLPDVVPGGDPGPYKRDPVMPPAEYPRAPKEPQIDTGGAPKPIDGGGTPPTPTDAAPTPPKPEESGGTPPTPGDTGGAAPTPSDGVNLPNKEYYMPQPGGGDG